ncbi:DUF2273 domain-containing protein [Streptococcus ferus]|uniref:DUF2273 domain-containing protein n=1 Tax=Streptococcus ferus TaxID=1345 RepID=UPI0035A145F9
MEVFQTYKYPILGAFFGLILALLLITIGFLKTLLLLIFIIFGAIGGWCLEKTGLLQSILIRSRNLYKNQGERYD